MLNMSYKTMLMSFVETSQMIILNGTNKSLQETADFIKSGDYTVSEVKEFDYEKQRFKKVSKNSVRLWCDHCTELDLILEKQRF